MKNQFTWFGVIAVVIISLSTFFVGCNKDDLNEVVAYKGQVVYINTTIPFADLTVKVTNGKDTHCQTQTDAGGFFSLKVRVNEIDGDYYLLAGDSTCIPQKVALGGYGQAEVDLGVIEVEGPALPTVKTTPLTEVTADGATLGGEVMTDGRMAVTARGICYGTEQQPTVDGTHTTEGGGLGTFTTTLKNLEHNTIYYARAYATNKKGTAYGDQVKFTTELGVPIVISDSVYRITAHSAKCKGHVESDGGYAVSKKGTCWSRQPDPTVDDECTNDGSGKGEFTSTLSGLLENTTYYVRTYATNATATVYGEQIIITTLDGLAVVKTDSVNNITATGFTAFGTVVSDCDIPVTARGFCYSTQQYPTIEDEHTTSGKGLGEFKSNITKLEYGTTYYVRAYATNETSTTYGEQIAVKTLTGLPTVSTAEVTNIGSVKATCGGNVTDDGSLTVTARGVCYGTEQYPTIEDKLTTNGKGLGEFTSNLTGLSDKTTYYVRAYATTAAGTTYGEQKTFRTENGIPVVLLSEVGEPTANSVVCKGNVTGDGGVTITERGFCYALTQYPTNTDLHVAIGNGVGEFTGSLTGLSLNSTYYIRAYAINSLGIGYSEQQSFTTKNGLATVTTGTATSAATSITVGGNVINNGGYAVTERGICYSTTNSEPTITDAFVVGGKGNGEFSVSITGLSASTTYYIRAYATNENGTAYGDAIQTVTKDGNASITLSEITKITALSASASVTITDAGSATLQSCGICWSTNPNPTITDSKTIASGKALNTAYTCNMAELQPNTTYYIRGYAATDVATAYSEQKTFITKDGAATISIGEITDITALTATGQVSVTDAGGATLQSCGICWATHPNPTILESKSIASGKVLNTAYTCNMTELQPNTTYYVRAYATTDITTSYSVQKTFKTTIGLPTISTVNATSTATTITVTGEITDNGGYNVTERGICYSTTNSEPTLAGEADTGGGQGNGSFSVTLYGMNPNTTYYVRAYAKNSNGAAYGETITISTQSGGASVTTGTIMNIKALSATGSVKVTNTAGATLQSCGICWSTNPNPTISNNKTLGGTQLNTSYDCNLTNLSPNTTYYVRGYAITNIATTYGSEISFKTTKGTPEITLSTLTNVQTKSFVANANITSDGGYAITSRGICWSSTNSTPTTEDSHYEVGTGTGSFTYTIANLQPNTTYYVRAYATNSIGTTYTEVRLQKTGNGLQGVHFNADPISNIKAATATCSVIVDYKYSDAPIISEGVCWSSTTTTPTINDTHTNEGKTTTSFTSTLTYLTPLTTYYVRAYATTSYGTAYSSNYISFTTTSGLPTVVTNEITTNGVTNTSFVCGGEVTDIGDAPVTARGICWNTTGTPTISDTHSSSGSGIGSFAHTVTGVSTTSQTYYIRAYATNKYGTSYGEVIVQNKNNPYHLQTVNINGTTFMVYPIDLGEMNWVDANTACEDINDYGFSDWRLPTSNELKAFIPNENTRRLFSDGVTYWTSTNSGTYLYASGCYCDSYYVHKIDYGSAYQNLVRSCVDWLKNVRPIRIMIQ